MEEEHSENKKHLNGLFRSGAVIRIKGSVLFGGGFVKEAFVYDDASA
jgi:hypothetical protein